MRCCCSYRRHLHRHPILRRRLQSIASAALWYVCRSEKLRRAIWSTRWTAATFRLLRASITNRSLSRRLSLPSRRRISKNGRRRASSSGPLQLPFPQCVSLRRGALMTPMRAIMARPLCSTTRCIASTAVCHSASCCSAFGLDKIWQRPQG